MCVTRAEAEAEAAALNEIRHRRAVHRASMPTARVITKDAWDGLLAELADARDHLRIVNPPANDLADRLEKRIKQLIGNRRFPKGLAAPTNATYRQNEDKV